ncbi:mitogen-activated protein kinase kinase kinase 1-like [Forsythia ovata]|uniref:Mitogen-activated protein kinase kinase kinase 1-like n=1 Tax=Forsythia ovata TaxID=205694 RepID=A0ABD1PUR0_9LAMI
MTIQGSSPRHQAAKPIPRLQRLNAVKNIDYEYLPSTSSTSALSASCSSEESLRGRSRDLYSGQTSFRIEGIDGQFEFICETLGFSGIEDFGIPVAEYEAMKVRPYVAPRLISQRIEDSNGNVLEISSGSGSISNLTNQVTQDSISNVIEISGHSCNKVVEVINQKIECNGIKDLGFSNSGRRSSFGIISSSDDDGLCELSKTLEDSARISNLVFSDNVSGKLGEICRNGIKGVRPPVLAPPPSMSLPVIDNDDGFFFAVKEVSLLDQGDEGKQRILQLEQEIALLSQFEHENIVQYYGTEKAESHLYIFLELVNKGSLMSLYQKYNLRDSQVSAYTRQILHGLKYLHERNVVHRDIKCANILVDANGLVKLADFGLAKATKLNDVKSCKGTPFWMAPEVVRCLGYGLAADIWSLGCTVLEMLTRSFPYSNMEPMSALYRIGRGGLPPIPESLSSDARNFILKCLQVDANVRPTASQLLDHPFVKRPLAASSGSASPHNFGQRI